MKSLCPNTTVQLCLDQRGKRRLVLDSRCFLADEIRSHRSDTHEQLIVGSDEGYRVLVGESSRLGESVKQ